VTAKIHHRTTLARLIDGNFLPASACGQSFRRFVQPLIHSNVLEWQRSGAGQRLAVLDCSALAEFISRQFPHEADTMANVSSRVESLARFRDTKALANDVPEVICVRAWGNGALLRDKEPVEIAEATRQHGVFSFLLSHSSRYSISGNCALVENPAVFAAFEQLSLPFDLVIYSHGRASNRLVDWFSASISPDYQILHLPDYDPVGLDEFERLRSRLGTHVRLYIPEHLPRLFARYAKRELLASPAAQIFLARLRDSQHSEVRDIVTLIDRHNGGLEQEALLIASP
jgi:hypothetical protein